VRAVFTALLLCLSIGTADAVCVLGMGDCLRPLKECDNCPEMIIIPPGSFIMGSPVTEIGHMGAEAPEHKVTIAKPIAVSKLELTFAEWDACAASGDCDPHVSDSGFGRGLQPAINVNWNDAQRYVGWISKMTGKNYRLLSEAEYEYSARAGTQTVFPWGNAIGKNTANCIGCGSQWDGKQTAPAGSFVANKYGLHDMVGNVWEWVEDCFHDNYVGAPTDGSAWTDGDCHLRVVRGGSWLHAVVVLRVAFRARAEVESRSNKTGFRVARTLAP
jgi:formylglycine-generating enzyme required for sulfatase activity